MNRYFFSGTVLAPYERLMQMIPAARKESLAEPSDRLEMVETLLCELDSEDLKSRVRAVAVTEEIFYKDAKHKKRFREARLTGKKNPSVAAAIYLLTSDAQLWERVRCAEDKPIKAEWERYAVLRAARDIYTSSYQLHKENLLEVNHESNATLQLIFQALLIQRFGIGILNEKGGYS